VGLDHTTVCLKRFDGDDRPQLQVLLQTQRSNGHGHRGEGEFRPDAPDHHRCRGPGGRDHGGGGGRYTARSGHEPVDGWDLAGVASSYWTLIAKTAYHDNQHGRAEPPMGGTGPEPTSN